MVSPPPSLSLSSTLRDLYTETWTTIPAAVLARSPSYMSKPELLRVLDFKLAFGQNRPALRSMLAALTPASVESSTREAFSTLLSTPSTATSTSLSRDSLARAFKPLLALRGIGPATASLVLSLLHADVPFFSDEAAVVALGLREKGGRKALKYTEKEYWAFWEHVGTLSGKSGETRRDWERRVWSEEWRPKEAKAKAKVADKSKKATRDVAEDNEPSGGRKRKAPAAPDEEGASSHRPHRTKKARR